jgi:nucleoside-diphosphate-sugar epimerase
MPLVFLSTCSIYGRLLDDVCRETSTVRPLTVYGKTKAFAEQIVRDAGGVALRPVTAFGRSFRIRADLLLHTLVQAGSDRLNTQRQHTFENHLRPDPISEWDGPAVLPPQTARE